MSSTTMDGLTIIDKFPPLTNLLKEIYDNNSEKFTDLKSYEDFISHYRNLLFAIIMTAYDSYDRLALSNVLSEAHKKVPGSYDKQTPSEWFEKLTNHLTHLIAIYTLIQAFDIPDTYNIVSELLKYGSDPSIVGCKCVEGISNFYVKRTGDALKTYTICANVMFCNKLTIYHRESITTYFRKELLSYAQLIYY